MRLAWCVASGTRPRPAAAWVMKPKAEILPTMRVSTGSAKTRKERAETRDAARAVSRRHACGSQPRVGTSFGRAERT